MRRIVISTLSALSLMSAAAGITAAHAAPPCKDAKGKFTKCVKPAAKGPCKDAKGKFIKCK